MTKRRRLVQVIVILLLIAGAGAWGLHRLRLVGDSVRTAHALHATGMLLVEFMKSHDNEWPKSWSDLDSVADEAFHVSDTGEEYIVELQSRVQIDWSHDRSSLLAMTFDSGKPIPLFVSPAPGHQNAWKESGNEQIVEYLQSLRSNRGQDAQIGAEDGPAR